MVTYYLYSKLTPPAPAGLANNISAIAMHPTLASAGISEAASQIVQHMTIQQAKWVATSVAAAAVLCVAGGAAVFNALNSPPTRTVTETPREARR
jgi:hypothetical protein